MRLDAQWRCWWNTCVARKPDPVTQISFYPLSDQDPDARLQFSCRLTEKARHKGLRVCILVDSQAQAAQLDTLLWSFKPTSFLPHSAPNNEQTSTAEAVQIAAKIGEFTNTDMLINLSGKPCIEHERFTRIDEILCADEEILAAGRELFKFYRSAGYQPKTHKL